MHASAIPLYIFLLKFGLSEKHTKFLKIFLKVLTNQLIYLVNVKTMRQIFLKLYVLLKKSEPYNSIFKKYSRCIYGINVMKIAKYVGCENKDKNDP